MTLLRPPVAGLLLLTLIGCSASGDAGPAREAVGYRFGSCGVPFEGPNDFQQFFSSKGYAVWTVEVRALGLDLDVLGTVRPSGEFPKRAASLKGNLK